MAKVTRSHASVIVAHDFTALMRDAVNDHRDAIMSEAIGIMSLSDHNRAACALVFGVISPRLKFAKNVAAVGPILAAIRAGVSDADLVRIAKENGVHLGNVHRALIANRALILNASGAVMNRETLLPLPGFGPKTSAFSIALYDLTREVYTLDTWMLRGLMIEVGFGGEKDTWEIGDTEYAMIEAALIAQANEIDEPVFLTQWALWNRFYEFRNEHMVHAPAFGLEQTPTGSWVKGQI